MSIEEYRESAHEVALQKTRARRRRDVDGPTMPCTHCAGSGRQPLRPAHVLTYGKITAEWQTTTAICAALCGLVRMTALVNRLHAMQKLGLIEARHPPGNFKMLEWRRHSLTPAQGEK